MELGRRQHAVMAAHEAQHHGADRDAEADAELLQHAAEAGGAAQFRGGQVGIGQRVGGHELRRPHQAEEEDRGGDQPARRRGLEQRKAPDEETADDRAADQHGPEAEPAQQAPRHHADEDGADAAHEGERARDDRAHAEPDLQHQRQQERCSVEPHAREPARQGSDREGAVSEQPQVDGRVGHPTGIDGEAEQQRGRARQQGDDRR